MSDENTNDKSIEYLDLLAATLTQYEKALDSLIEKLEKASDALVKTVSQQPRKATIIQEETADAITFTKIEIPYNRPIEEITKILETLTAKSKS